MSKQAWRFVLKRKKNRRKRENRKSREREGEKERERVRATAQEPFKHEARPTKTMPITT